MNFMYGCSLYFLFCVVHLQSGELSGKSTDAIVVSAITLTILCIIFFSTSCCLLVRQWRLRNKVAGKPMHRRRGICPYNSKEPKPVGGSSGYLPLPGRSETPESLFETPYGPDRQEPNLATSVPNYQLRTVCQPGNDQLPHPYYPSPPTPAPNHPASPNLEAAEQPSHQIKHHRRSVSVPRRLPSLCKPKQQIVSPLITGSSVAGGDNTGSVGPHKRLLDSLPRPPRRIRKFSRSQSWTEDELLKKIRPDRGASPAASEMRPLRDSFPAQSLDSSMDSLTDMADGTGIFSAPLTPTSDWRRSCSSPAGLEAADWSAPASPALDTIISSLSDRSALKFNFHYAMYNSTLRITNIEFFESTKPQPTMPLGPSSSTVPTQSLVVKVSIEHDASSRVKTGPIVKQANSVAFPDVLNLKIANITEASRMRLVLEVYAVCYSLGPVRSKKLLGKGTYGLDSVRDIEECNNGFCELR